MLLFEEVLGSKNGGNSVYMGVMPNAMTTVQQDNYEQKKIK
jgi:hypothetical protein